MKGFGFYVSIILIFILAIWISNYFKEQNGDPYSYNVFQSDLTEKKDNISKVEIFQSEDTPSGSVKVTFKDGTKKTFSTTSTVNIETYLQEMDQSYTDRKSVV